jgi:hypothetical protein
MAAAIVLLLVLELVLGRKVLGAGFRLRQGFDGQVWMLVNGRRPIANAQTTRHLEVPRPT